MQGGAAAHGDPAQPQAQVAAGVKGDLDQLRASVAAGARRVATEGLVLGTAGNVSQRAGEVVAITPSGASLRELRPEQVALVDLEGIQLGGELAASSELALHLGVYRRYRAGAIVHAHSVFGTALSCVLDRLPVVHYAMLALGGDVRVARYETFGTPELAEAVLEALRDRSAALMANHGTVVHGADVEGAVERALLLEWCCEVYWRAAQIGTPRTLSDQQLRDVVESARRHNYDALSR